jgi:hypothetical protein
MNKISLIFVILAETAPEEENINEVNGFHAASEAGE